MPRDTPRKIRGRVVRYSFLVRNFHPLLPAGLSRRFPDINRDVRPVALLTMLATDQHLLLTFGLLCPFRGISAQGLGCRISKNFGNQVACSDIVKVGNHQLEDRASAPHGSDLLATIAERPVPKRLPLLYVQDGVARTIDC